MIVVGVGFAMVVVVFLLDIYYTVILAWAWYYMFASFTDVSEHFMALLKLTIHR